MTTRAPSRTLRIAVGAVAMLGLLNQARSEDVDFEPSLDFVQLPTGMKLGKCSAVSVNSKGDVFLFHRGRQPIIRLNAKGVYQSSWGDGMFHTPHGLRIDREDNVWVTDAGNHRVFKFSSTGRMLQVLGNGKPGVAADQFNRPTDIAFNSKDEFFISDGYGNSRVMKFSPEGRFIGAWGTPGKGPGQFDLPHSIVVDAQDRVIVGDRENNRIQVFDSDGKHLATFAGFAPYGLALDKRGRLFVADGRAAKILHVGNDGKVVGSWGQLGDGPGQFRMPHMLTFDASGNLLVAEVNGSRLQLLKREPKQE